MKDKDGEILTRDEDVMKRWEQYFQELLNRPDTVNPIYEEMYYGPELELAPPTRVETNKATKSEKRPKTRMHPIPLLFNLVMEKVARSITARPEGVTYNNLKINCLGSADDIDIIGVNLREVENLTTQFKTTAYQVGLEINEGKTKIMEVARTLQLQGNVDLADIKIETVESFKYLVTNMSQNAVMAEEVTAKIGASNRCYFSLTDLFK
ncbi:uncharacterized protein [Palaemon carinicauda]|uniref:uncharacterized protein n=1 Tax=Palaemon carinicauda TaxID=392227 RepID=UPI0035B5E94C